MVKNTPADAGDAGLIPGWLFLNPRKEKATPSSILAWRLPWTEASGRLESIGSQKCRMQLSNWTITGSLREKRIVVP